MRRRLRRKLLDLERRILMRKLLMKRRLLRQQLLSCKLARAIHHILLRRRLLRRVKRRAARGRSEGRGRPRRRTARAAICLLREHRSRRAQLRGQRCTS